MQFAAGEPRFTASEPVWALPLDGLCRVLQIAPEGLSSAAAAERLERCGANRLPTQQHRPLLLRLADQLLHFMALLLWVAGALAFVAGMPQLGWAIWAVVLINGFFSFWQEFQAERALEALSRSLPRQVQVWRDGELRQLAADQLVAGDRVALEEGDRIPADCRITRALGLSVDLAALTGESLPVARQAAAMPPPAAADLLPPNHHLPASERSNLLLAGTTVAAGRAEGFVYATGAETEFGQVARLTAGTRRSASTLEVQVARIVHTISTVAVSMGVLAFLLSVLFVGLGPLESLVFAVGIIVANVPEGLLPTVTLALALSVQRMARSRALVRRLSAVETLGSVSVICCDKTGTLTAARMAVDQTWQPKPSGCCCSAPASAAMPATVAPGPAAMPRKRRSWRRRRRPASIRQWSRSAIRGWRRSPSIPIAAAWPWWCAGPGSCPWRRPARPLGRTLGVRRRWCWWPRGRPWNCWPRAATSWRSRAVSASMPPGARRWWRPMTPWPCGASGCWRWPFAWCRRGAFPPLGPMGGHRSPPCLAPPWAALRLRPQQQRGRRRRNGLFGRGGGRRRRRKCCGGFLVWVRVWGCSRWG